MVGEDSWPSYESITATLDLLEYIINPRGLLFCYFEIMVALNLSMPCSNYHYIASSYSGGSEVPYIVLS
ncbi:hypothetical protein SADUNF_Sadunf05G0082700 [Salix dunnii]|uniref:Uncharacterized protein n=1 Tax=Salix dunnii TaxID=1413687 RepID=A0A835K557_9ROSI|nr:hypothetical protein SADUNF_Sadunf05G0082700 [Salix dunnii]